MSKKFRYTETWTTPDQHLSLNERLKTCTDNPHALYMLIREKTIGQNYPRDKPKHDATRVNVNYNHRPRNLIPVPLDELNTLEDKE